MISAASGGTECHPTERIMAASSAIYPPDFVVMSTREFCHSIDWWREKLGHTWNDLADAGGIPVGTLKNMARHGRISTVITLEEFFRLTFALGFIPFVSGSSKLPGDTSVVALFRERRRIRLDPVVPITKR